MSSDENKLFYSPVYGSTLIFFGVIFTAIFILGYVIADISEALFYNILSALMIIIGYGILTGPYAIYSDQELILYTYGFKVRKTISYEDKTEIEVKNNHLYHQGKKIQMNDWFIKKADWNRMIQFYSSSEEALLSELKD